MTGFKNCALVTVLSLLSLWIAPAEARGCGWCSRWFGAAPTTTYYAPYTASYTPAGYGQVVNYMPVTAYRTLYVNTPVVSYRPIAGCDPCTGCPTTVMRPITSYAMQPRLVPYTTYRPVVVANYVPAPIAVTTPAYYAPPVGIAAPAAPVPTGCAPGYGSAPAVVPGALGAGVPSLAPQSYAAPGQPYPPAGALQPTTAQPSLAPPPAQSPSQSSSTGQAPAGQSQENRTFEPSNSDKPEPESRLLDPRDGESSNSNTSGGLRLLETETQDRTTALPIRQVYAARPVSFNAPAVPAVKRLDNSGWRAAN